MLRAVRANRSLSLEVQFLLDLLPYVLIAILPLIGAFPGISSFEIHFLDYLIPSQMLLVILGAALLGVAYFMTPKAESKRSQCCTRGFILLFCLMAVWGLVRSVLDNGSVARSLMQSVWMIAPLLYAFFLVGIMSRRGVRFQSVCELIVISAALLSGMLIVYNFIAYDFNIVRDRLYCPGLGPVALGYTNALVLALALALKGRSFGVLRRLVSISVLVLLLTTLLTGSRGGIYPAIALAIAFYLPTKNAAAMALVGLGIAIVFLAINPVELLLSGRAGNLQSGRYETWNAALVVFDEGTSLDKLIGYGAGNVFPFQDWYTAYYDGLIERGSGDGAWNSFSFNGNLMLVEPHNTYIWLLLEGGIVGLVSFVAIIVTFIKRCKAKGSRLRFPIVALTFTVLCVFDAVLLANAASAFWWTVLSVSYAASIDLEVVER